MAWGALAGLAGGLLGAISGSQGSNSTQTSQLNLAPASEAEKQGGQVQTDQLTALQQLVGLGPGASDVTNSLNSTRGLASLLQQYSTNGAMPTSQDYANANYMAQNAFAGQQQQLAQSAQDQQMAANRQAAKMGRAPNDPIFMNKLMQEQTRQQQALGSQMSSYAAQQAQYMPLQRLEMTNQLAQVQSGLASQAMANRQALFGLGSQLKQQEQQFRLNSADRTTTQTGGGGLAGAINGGLAGFGTGMGVASMFGNIGSNTNGNPWAGNNQGTGPLVSYGN